MKTKRSRSSLVILGMGLSLALTLFAGVLATSAKPAEAAWYYRVYPYKVCQWQYPSPGAFVGASSWQPWNAYSLYCYRISFAGREYLGGLNIQGYCAAKYPGSRSVVINNGWYALDDWYCRMG